MQRSQQSAASAHLAELLSADLTDLGLLSFLLTANHAQAERCFVAGLEDCGQGNASFQEWSRSWARRTIICNAVRSLRSRPERDTLTPAPLYGAYPRWGRTREAEAAITGILKLKDFERFVLVMSVLEKYSDQDCSVLLGCSRQDIGQARARALGHVGGSETIGSAGSGARTKASRADFLPGAAIGCLMVTLLAGAAFLLNPRPASAQSALAATAQESDGIPALVVGFLGGFVHSDDFRHPEAQIGRQLQAAYGSRVRVEMFENRQRAQAHKLIVDYLRSRSSGKRAGGEKRAAPIILFGHSWGASAVVSLARELQRDSIPVSLTIQVDSIAKNGENDAVIPANVSEAINFYQRDGLLHGRSEIKAADPSHTRILGNLRFTYHKEPAECRAYPWYDRILFKGHTAIECDPRVWDQVEDLIRTRLPEGLQPTSAATVTRTGD